MDKFLLTFTGFRNQIISIIYKKLLKPYFFSKDPEDVHDRMLNTGEFLGKYVVTRKLTKLMFSFSHNLLEQNILGIKFKNPIGLAAGFDKNAVLPHILTEVGFGFAELGSITFKPYEGNPKPRLYRLPKSNSLIINYGLKNEGAPRIIERLEKSNIRLPIGISIAKTNCKETAEICEGAEDYLRAYNLFLNSKVKQSYFTINISCPNAYGGQPFTDKKSFNTLLEKIFSLEKKHPIFIKMSPDLTKKELDDIIEITDQYDIDGFISTNLVKDRTKINIIEKDIPPSGGISGKLVQEHSLKQINYLKSKVGDRYTIIACGGVFTSQDAIKAFEAGADLIQMISGMIYQGPQTISEINRGIVKEMKKRRYKSISEFHAVN